MIHIRLSQSYFRAVVATIPTSSHVWCVAYTSWRYAQAVCAVLISTETTREAKPCIISTPKAGGQMDRQTDRITPWGKSLKPLERYGKYQTVDVERKSSTIMVAPCGRDAQDIQQSLWYRSGTSTTALWNTAGQSSCEQTKEK